MGSYKILWCYVPDFEWSSILSEAHGGDVGGHYAGKATTHKILRGGLWWLTLHRDLEVYYRACNACQRMVKSLQRDELPLNPQVSLQRFKKWEIDFVGPIQPPWKRTGAQYIITVTKYLTRWVEAQPIKDCIGVIAMKFPFEYVLTKFFCPKVLMSAHDTHFLNETINALTEFQVYHQKSTPYHPWDNGTVEAFNNILENAQIKVYNVYRNDWDVWVPTVLWAYITSKKLTGHTSFRLVYGVETVMSMEYIVPSPRVVAFTGMVDCRA